MALTKDVDADRLDEPFVFWTLGLDNRDRREVPKHIYFTNFANIRRITAARATIWSVRRD